MACYNKEIADCGQQTADTTGHPQSAIRNPQSLMRVLSVERQTRRM